MCGIAGIFDTSGRRPLDGALLLRMAETLVHRGPDGSGQHLEAGLGLAHRRLSIIDLEGGHQPMISPATGAILVFNGEIYNFRALRDQLSACGHQFRTSSDTEAILHAWAEWGRDCVNHFDGMFAFALWDPATQALFLARDRMGKKPLYYAELPGGLLLFGSELKALEAYPDLRRDIDPKAVEDYFAYGYIPDPRSIYTSVSKLPPAHSLYWQRGQSPRLSAWWDISFDDRPMADGLAQRQLWDLVQQSTRERLIADVPLGAFLSGGVDSSAVVAAMAGAMTDPVKTCAVGFDDPRVDETSYAREVASQYKTDHSEQIVKADDFDLIGRLAGVYDEPFGDISALPTYRVCEAARQRVTVALSGDGGDEAFAGYRRYLWHMREEGVRNRLSPGIRKALFGTLGRVYPKLARAPRFLRAKTTFEELALDDVGAYFLSVSVTPDGDRRALFSGDLQTRLSDYHAAEVLRDHWQKADTEDALKKAQYADVKTWLAGDILVKVDRASMAHSLEVRSPFLDHNLMEWGINLPASLKLDGGEKKAILKKALEPHLPANILYRPKQGFVPPVAEWFRGPLKDRVRQSLTGDTLHSSGLFEMSAIERLLGEHQSGARDHGRSLWMLLMFEQFLDRQKGLSS